MTKPLSDEAHRLLSEAPRFEGLPFVCPSIFDPTKYMTDNTYHHGWCRILERSGVPHVGTHGIRHRAATDIANSGIPLKVGMALTAHKTVTMFMRYIHTEDDPVRMAADLVAARRRGVAPKAATPEQTDDSESGLEAEDADGEAQGLGAEPTLLAPLPGFEDRKYASRTKAGNYRPFRHRTGPNRPVPPDTQRARREGTMEDQNAAT